MIGLRGFILPIFSPGEASSLSVQNVVHAARSLGRRLGVVVRVDVARSADSGVSKLTGHDVQPNPSAEGQHGVGVPSSVQGDGVTPSFGHEPLPPGDQRVGMMSARLVPVTIYDPGIPRPPSSRHAAGPTPTPGLSPNLRGVKGSVSCGRCAVV